MSREGSTGRGDTPRWLRDARLARRNHPRFSTVFGWCLAVSLALSSCRSGDDVAFEDARRIHTQLVTAGERLDSPRFNEVLEKLKQVAPESKHGADARRLHDAIEAVRQPVRRPLAETHADPSTLPPDVAAQSRACARLAELIGADGGATPSGLAALADCRKRLDRVADEAHHRETPPPK